MADRASGEAGVGPSTRPSQARCRSTRQVTSSVRIGSPASYRSLPGIPAIRIRGPSWPISFGTGPAWRRLRMAPSWAKNGGTTLSQAAPPAAPSAGATATGWTGSRVRACSAGPLRGGPRISQGALGPKPRQRRSARSCPGLAQRVLVQPAGRGRAPPRVRRPRTGRSRHRPRRLRARPRAGAERSVDPEPFAGGADDRLGVRPRRCRRSDRRQAPTSSPSRVTSTGVACAAGSCSRARPSGRRMVGQPRRRLRLPRTHRQDGKAGQLTCQLNPCQLGLKFHGPPLTSCGRPTETTNAPSLTDERTH